MSELSSEVETKKLPTKIFVGYGVLALPLTLLAMTFYVYIPKYYSDVVGLDLAVMSNILFISRAWDALIDPLIGSLSDRTKGKWGRRRPWIGLGVLPLAICFLLLLSPSLRPEACSVAVWYTVFSVLFFLFWTIVQVPYEALGAEVSQNYHERTKLLGFREGFLVLGTLLSAIFPVLLSLDKLDSTAGSKFLFLGVAYSILLVALALCCIAVVRERQIEEGQRNDQGLVVSFKQVMSNRPFRILLLAYTIGAFGGGLPAALIIYYVPYVLKSDQSSLFLCLYFVIGFCFLPGWVKLSRSIGKKESWIAAMFINTAAFAGVLFLGPGDELAYGILVSISAVGFGATLAIPSSMQADVIDYDEMLSGKRKEGQFVGFWYICKKLAAAFGSAMAFRVLATTGYVPNVAQNDSTIFALKILYAGVPCLCNFLAIAIAWKYPIDDKRYAEIRAALDSRTEGASKK